MGSSFEFHASIRGWLRSTTTTCSRIRPPSHGKSQRGLVSNVGSPRRMRASHATYPLGMSSLRATTRIHPARSRSHSHARSSGPLANTHQVKVGESDTLWYASVVVSLSAPVVDSQE